MKKIVSVILGSIIFLSGFSIAYLIFKKSSQHIQVNSETIVTALKSEGFLVTQTFIFNQQVTINKSSGSEWKDIFWGQTITASANMKIHSGVDLTQIQSEDIKISPEQIMVYLPPTKQESIEVLDSITLENKQGILKRIFNNDDGYNIAYVQLKEEALKTASTKDLQQEARVSAQQQLVRLMRFIVPQKKVQIIFK